MAVEISVTGLDEAVRTIAQGVDAAVDVDRIADAAAAVLINRIRTRFRDQTDADGRKWPPSRAAQRRAAGIPTGTSRRPGGYVGGFTLFESGALFNSLQVFNDGTGNRLIGTDVFYGKFHQEGTRFLPKREFLGFNDEDAEVAEQVALAEITRALRTT